MEEKKVTKISLSTFLLIIAVIALLIMGFYIYKLSDEKTVALEKINTLNNQSASIENKKSIIEDKTLLE